jgi:hypothetical protein
MLLFGHFKIIIMNFRILAYYMLLWPNLIVVMTLFFLFFVKLILFLFASLIIIIIGDFLNFIFVMYFVVGEAEIHFGVAFALLLLKFI